MKLIGIKSLLKSLLKTLKNEQLDIEKQEDDGKKVEEIKAEFLKSLTKEMQEKYKKISETNYIITTYNSQRLFEYGFQESIRLKRNIEYNIKIHDLTMLEKELVYILKKAQN